MPRARIPTDAPADSHVELEYEVQEALEGEGRPLVLIRGLGTQMIQWAPGFCERLRAEGHRLILFDNRDVGLSTHFDHVGSPDIAKIMQQASQGIPPDVAYLLKDMAADVVGLLDHLGIERAHVFGMSMGGMIVQELAIRFPERVASLVSVMSTTGEPGLPGPTDEAAAVLQTPAPTEHDAYLEHAVRSARVLSSPGYPFDEAAVRAMAERIFARRVDPVGVARQFAAVAASGPRHEALSKVSCPSLVIHGDADPLIRLAGGEATARAIPGARLVVLPGMGHELPTGAWARLVEETTRHTKAAERA